ncbi:hypothetical protein DFO66_102279 [Brevibacterium sanguinis]|uniref:Uncharacterized protein n=2 Tax=Brevibacterium TaxID=1696 RepID=A0A366ILZ6_9MICO|nr:MULTISPECIES: hypothetical protein [Brevibacterium]RBP67226.1 hypothetical protein DFO66_102279 [Brevibacterium sanguinis]RBP73751.1 hypothetical protein DFO65_102279 [Brevibacterium celere]
MSRALSERELEVAVEMIRRAQVSAGLNGSSAQLFELNHNHTLGKPRADSSARLRRTTDRRAVWAANLANTVVSDTCACGKCPSIALALPDDTPRYAHDAERSSFILDAVSGSAIVVLFVENDVPVYLELVPPFDAEAIEEFPTAESLVFTSEPPA